MRSIPIRFAGIALGALLWACADQTAPPGAPRFAAGGQGNGQGLASLDLIEQDYDAAALDRDQAARYRQYAVSAPEKLPARYRSDVAGKDATLSLLRTALDWNDLSHTTQQEILDLQATGFGQLKETLETPHFVLHYAIQGAHAVPAPDGNRNGTPDYIDIAAESWELIWDREIGQLGYPAPKGTPAQKFHVYYQNLRLYYGYTAATNVALLASSPVPLGTASGYIVVENDFAEGFPPNDEDVTGTETIRSGALKVTQAHEFMHASQFNINVYQSGWLFESHATWAEDAVYDGINDWHWYINRFLVNPDAPVFNRYVYGSAFFQNWLSETFGVDVPRQIWLAARTRSTPDAVRDAAFGGTWDGVKAFAPAEYLLDLSDFTRDPPSVVPLPRNFINATWSSYPVSVQVPPTSNRLPNRAPWGLGANFVEFQATVSGVLTLTFDGTDGYAWRAYAVATAANGRTSVFPIPLDAAAAGELSLAGFGPRWSRVTLVTTIADRPGAAVPYAYGATVR